MKPAKGAGRSLTPLTLLVLALPFLAGIMATGGLVQPYHTFHWSDEQVFHYPTILQFERELPQPNLRRYPSATTPLFHLLFAVLARTLHLDLIALRYVNVAISYLCVLLVFLLLRRRMGLPVTAATGLAFLFAISPYFYGASFILLTDNLALLLVMGSLILLYPNASVRTIGGGLLLAMLAVMTRQSHVWVYAVAAYVIARSNHNPWVKVTLVGCAIASLLPLTALLAAWGGAFPPGFARHTSASWELRGPAFVFSIFALYAALLFPVSINLLARAGRGGLLAVSLALLLLLVLPVSYQPGDDGYLWRLASHLPRFLGTDVVFWILLPLGAILLLLASRGAGPAVGPALMTLVAVAAVSAQGGTLYQKYFDPLVLLAVFQLRPRSITKDWRYTIPALVLGLCFAAYAASPLRELLVRSIRHGN